MNYIEIPRWEDFQHYSKRDPIWIKNYTRLLHDDAYRTLSGHQRAVLHGLWLMYASSGCRIALNTSSISSQLGLRVTWKQLTSLSDAGFIRVIASTPLAQRYTRVEKSREEKDTNNVDVPNPLLEEPLLKVVGWEGVLRDI